MNPQLQSPLDLPLDPRSGVPLDIALQIDKLCEEFERSLGGATHRPIESYLAGLPDSARTVCLRELLAIELEYQVKQGESPRLDDYQARYSQHASLVGLLFAELYQGEEEGTQAIARKEEPTILPACLVNHPRYKVLRLLGKGGMGEVYLAEHRVMDRQVALKVIGAAIVGEGTARDRFHREIRAASKLHHPNIVTAFDADQIGDTAVFAMEYVPGENLAQRVADSGPLPIEQACEYVRQAAFGLAHAHELGMVHRDIKPHNLMVTTQGQVKILDFGLAHFASDGRDITRDGALVGTIDYMAPEQADDSHSADIRSDIYSLGCTLYFLLSGTPPFAGGSPIARLKAHSDSDPPPLPKLPADLADVLMKMLAKSPADRYQRPEEVALALAPFAVRPPVVPHAEGDGGLLRGAQSSSIRWIALATLAAVGIFAFANWFSSPGPAPAETIESTQIPAEAVKLYEQAMAQLSHRQEGHTQSAVGRLNDAILLEPKYLEAHIALANAYNLQADYGWEMSTVVSPLALQAANRAIDLNPKSSGAHLALACVLDAYDGNAAKAEKEYLLALELDPKSASAHHWYAWFLVQHEDFATAFQHIEDAFKLEPAETVLATNRGRIHYFSRSYLTALQHFDEALDLDPKATKALMDRAMTLVERKRLVDALTDLDKAGSGQTNDGRDVMARWAYALARGGEKDQARKLLVKLELLSATKPLAYEVATIYVALEEFDKAFAWLDRAILQERSVWKNYLRIDPRLDKIGDDPRFQEYLQALNKYPRLKGKPASGGP